MAYVFTGNERSLTFSLDKTVGGVRVLGYPIPYDGRLAFPGYAAITDEAARRLSTADFNSRLNAFLAYIESVESGFDSTTDFTNSSTQVDTGTCPPPPTTTAPVTTTTTTAA